MDMLLSMLNTLKEISFIFEKHDVWYILFFEEYDFKL